MRLDYVLYGLATASFVASAYLFLTTAQILYVGSTAGVGLILVAGGLFLKPKQPTSTPEPTSTPIAQTADLKPTPTIQTVPAAAQAPIQPAKEQTLVVQSAAVTEIQAVPQTSVSIATVTSVGSAPETKASELTNIRGINEKRAAQLNANGIATIADLANASSSELASKLGVSERIVKMWIGTAKKMTK